jgi:hypothetical protein
MSITITKKPKGLVYGEIGKKTKQEMVEEFQERQYQKHLRILKKSGWKPRTIKEIFKNIDDMFYRRR